MSNRNSLCFLITEAVSDSGILLLCSLAACIPTLAARRGWACASGRSPLRYLRSWGSDKHGHTSVKAVAANPSAMAVWAAMIVFLTALGFATFLLGLVFILPVLGHAT